MKKLVGFGDNRTSKIVVRIADEEVAHVAVGVSWFISVCQKMGRVPYSAFRGIHLISQIGAHDVEKQFQLPEKEDMSPLKQSNHVFGNAALLCRPFEGVQRRGKRAFQLFGSRRGWTSSSLVSLACYPVTVLVNWPFSGDKNGIDLCLYSRLMAGLDPCPPFNFLSNVNCILSLSLELISYMVTPFLLFGFFFPFSFSSAGGCP